MTQTAIVHDYLTQRGGAERVVVQLAEAFPDAPIHTSLYAPEATFPQLDRTRVQPSPLNQIDSLRRDHRRALPFLAPLFSRLEVPADVVVCSSSGWAHGIRTSGRKIVYCYTPARWLYQRDRYTEGLPVGRRAALGAMAPVLRRWDRHRASSADRYLAISSVVRDRIRQVYGIDAEVIPPPFALDVDGEQSPVAGVQPGAWLTVARLLPYKNVDVVIRAFRGLTERRLVVVGDGPEADRLRRLAPPNVTLVGTVSDPQLRWLYANCAGTVAAAYEDFGMTPLEAAAFGKPTVAIRFGGYLDTIVDGETGLLVDAPTPDAIRRAVRRASDRSFSRRRLIEQADRFHPKRFRSRMQEIVAEAAAG